LISAYNPPVKWNDYLGNKFVIKNGRATIYVDDGNRWIPIVEKDIAKKT
jgi:hypothetical protein